MDLLHLLHRSGQSLVHARQAAEVTRFLANVYSLSRVNRRDVIEFVSVNQTVLLGWATTFELSVLYLTCILDAADRSDPRGKQMAENWIAATDRAMKRGVKLSAQLFRGLAAAAMTSYGVDADEVVRRGPNR
jgi:hypothetical protein